MPSQQEDEDCRTVLNKACMSKLFFFTVRLNLIIILVYVLSDAHMKVVTHYIHCFFSCFLQQLLLRVYNMQCINMPTVFEAFVFKTFLCKSI